MENFANMKGYGNSLASIILEDLMTAALSGENKSAPMKSSDDLFGSDTR